MVETHRQPKVNVMIMGDRRREVDVMSNEVVRSSICINATRGSGGDVPRGTLARGKQSPSSSIHGARERQQQEHLQEEEKRSREKDVAMI